MMRAALSKVKPSYPENWDAFRQGQLIKTELELALAPFAETLFGYHLVKLGRLSAELNMSSCPIKHVISLTEGACERSSARGLSRELPLQQNCIDAFLLAGELDFAQDPHQILREVDRAITANGHLVIAGFNPYSLAGLLKYMPFNRGNILHEARFFNRARIIDWLQLLGFEILRVEPVLYSSLFLDRRFSPSSYLQRWFKTYLPYFSSMYIIEARKRETPLSTIKPKWKLNPSFSPASARARNQVSLRADISNK